MSRQFVFVTVLTLIAGVGCRTSGTGRQVDASLRAARFTETEVFTKTWKDAMGKDLRLLDSEIIDLKFRGQLLIAKYGDTNTGNVTCLDFYRVRKTVKPDGRFFVLVWHDYSPSMVTSIIPQQQDDDRVEFQITRETIPGTEGRRGKRLYWLAYSKDYTMGDVVHEMFFDIPEAKESLKSQANQ